MISYLLINEHYVLLVAITFQQMLPSQLVEKLANVYSHESSFLVENQAEINIRVATELNMTYGGILYVKEFAEDEKIIQKDCSERTNTGFCHMVHLDKDEHRRCFKEILFDYRNETRLNESLKIISDDPRMRVLIVYGNWGSNIYISKEIPTFIRFERQESPYFLTSFSRQFTNRTANYSGLGQFYLFKNIPGGMAFDDLMNLLMGLRERIIDGTAGIFYAMDKVDVKYQSLLRILMPGYEPGEPPTDEIHDKWRNISLPIREHIANSIIQDDSTMLLLMQTWKDLSYHKQKESEDWARAYYYSPTRVLNESKPFCDLEIPTCGEGEELHHGMYHESKWQNSYGWFCKKCNENFYKETMGNSKCQPCSHPFKTNEG